MMISYVLCKYNWLIINVNQLSLPDWTQTLPRKLLNILHDNDSSQLFSRCRCISIIAHNVRRGSDEAFVLLCQNIKHTLQIPCCNCFVPVTTFSDIITSNKRKNRQNRCRLNHIWNLLDRQHHYCAKCQFLVLVVKLFGLHRTCRLM